MATYSDTVEFYAPSIAFEDAEANLPDILAKRGIGSAELTYGLGTVRRLVAEISDGDTLPMRAEALRRIGRRDPDDWPIVAAALVLNCPIWTEDRDFFGAGVATWTSDLVEIYLRNEREADDTGD